MSRLTTNKPESEMGMYELAHNGCYITEGGFVRYRDYDTDIDARELARDIMRGFGLWEIDDDEMLSDETFDNEIAENLMYGTKELEGLIALFYRNLWVMAELRERLKHYEDLEEQGRLLELPCKVGDEFFIVAYRDDRIIKVVCTGYSIGIDTINPKTDVSIIWINSVERPRDYWKVTFEQFKNQCFATKEEAEKVLEEMRGSR